MGWIRVFGDFLWLAFRPIPQAETAWGIVSTFFFILVLLGISSVGFFAPSPLPEDSPKWPMLVSYPIFAIALLFFVAGARLQRRQQELIEPRVEIVYDPNDPRFVEPIRARRRTEILDDLAYRFCIAVRLNGVKSVQAEVVLAHIYPNPDGIRPHPLHVVMNPQGIGADAMPSTFQLNPSKHTLHFIEVCIWNPAQEENRQLEITWHNPMGIRSHLANGNYEMEIEVHVANGVGATRRFALEFDQDGKPSFLDINAP